MEIIQILIIIFAAFVITRILLRLKDNKLTIGEFLLWIFLWGAVLLVAFVPSVSSLLARVLGIGRGVDLLIYLALLILFYMMFRMIIKLESVQQEITSIVRQVALERGLNKSQKPKKRKKEKETKRQKRL